MMRRLAGLLLLFALAVPAGLASAQQGFVGTLVATPERGPVGTRVTLTGSDLPPSTAVTVLWTTVAADWVLERSEGELTGFFTGRSLEEVQQPLATGMTDSSGRFSTVVKIPEDHGGVHDIYLAAGDRVLTKVGVRTIPAVTMTPASGPLGTPIRFTITGLDPVNSLETWYWLLYDNKLVGYATALRSRGTARFTIPATGEPGLHVLELFSGAPGAPYRAPDTSPLRVNIPLVFQFRFRLTEGRPILPPPIEAQAEKPTAGIEPPEASPTIWTNPNAAPVGLSATLYGKGFGSGDRVDVLYYNKKGSRMTTDRAGTSRNSGFLQYYEEIGTVTAGSDGRFAWKFSVPDMLGGEHVIGARVRGEQVAETRLFVHRLAFPLPATRYRVGEEIVVHVKGVGWTEGDNIFAINYDNSYIGYACGFNSNGDVIVRIQASGAPGWHYIDLYPTFYRVKEYSKTMELPFLFRYSMLTWQDHPQPFVFRYAFQIVK